MRSRHQYVCPAIALVLLLTALAVVGCGDSGPTPAKDTSPVRDTSPDTSPSSSGEGKAELLLFTQPG